MEMGDKISNSESAPLYPIYFSKMADMIIGDKMDIESYSDMSKTLDYEVEMAVIIGKKGKDISKGRS